MSITESPLGRWLRENEIGQTEFARQLSKKSGLTVPSTRVCEWSRRICPDRRYRHLISKLTKGAVNDDQWTAWRQLRDATR